MKADHVFREAINKTNTDQIYMVYTLEESDDVQNWLYEGLSHACSHVWQRTWASLLRPLKTRCGIIVSTHLDMKNDQLFNLVKVDTTCVWCVSGKVKEE